MRSLEGPGAAVARCASVASSVIASPSILDRWHLLSLDAPTVAVVWTEFIARCAGVKPPWQDLAAMFLAVWMIYAADRLLDSRVLEANGDAPDMEERHRFHHRYRARFLGAVLAAAVALVFLLPRLDGRAMERYVLPATLLAVWMLWIHARPAATRRLPKEVAVGLFFPVAVFLPTVARAPWLQRKLLPAAMLFALVCTLNCLLIYAREHPGEDSRTRAHWTTRVALRHLRWLLWLGVVLPLGATAAAVVERSSLTPLPGLACCMSGAILLFLHQRRSSFPGLRLRALADVALLTPLLLLALCRFAS